MRLRIEKLDFQGRGIGYWNHKILFVPQVLPDETVEVDIISEKKTYQIGRLQEVVVPSNLRMKPKCPYYGICGGCDYQHVSYEDSVSFKAQGLTDLFQHHKLWNSPIEVFSSKKPWNYRNKLSLKVEEGRIGFYSLETHQFVEIKECAIARVCINALLHDFSLFSFQNGELILRCNENDEILMNFLTSDEVIVHEELFQRHKIVGILKNHHVVFGKPFFYERKNGVLYQVSCDSFFQVNPEVSKELFLYVRNLCNHSRKLLDLYCGVGTLGEQVQNQDVQVTGIEVVPNAILNAMKNASLNHRTNFSYHLGKVENLLSKIPMDFDTILVDPPRSGLDKKTIDAILRIQAPRIIYVSCNPMTLIRDLKCLFDMYELSCVKGFDMFPYTKHVETIVLLSRKSLDSH